MKSVTLNAYPRTAIRRSAVKKLRDAGRIPAVIYGSASQPQSLEVVSKELDNLIHHHVSENVLVDLTLESDARPQRLALVQEVQHHPLSGKVLHVDFHEVAADEPVTISVPVETTGEAVGVKTGGGVLEHVLYKIKICALPKDLPEAITIDVSALEIGRAIHVGDIQPPEGVEVIGNKELVVVACAAPRTETEEAPVEGEAAAAPTSEVEMIKEKKEEAGVEKAGEGEKKK